MKSSSIIKTGLGSFYLSRATFLGRGCYGRAYGVNRRLAIKITTELGEFETAQLLEGRDIPHVWKVYETGEVRDGSPLHRWLDGQFHVSGYETYYYIVGERLKKWNSDKQKCSPTVATRKMNQALDKLFGIWHSDAHYGNLLMTNGGTLKFIDVM